MAEENLTKPLNEHMITEMGALPKWEQSKN